MGCYKQKLAAASHMWLNANQTVMCDVGAKVACPAVVFRRVDFPPAPQTWRQRNTTLLKRTAVEASASQILMYMLLKRNLLIEKPILKNTLSTLHAVQPIIVSRDLFCNHSSSVSSGNMIKNYLTFSFYISKV